MNLNLIYFSPTYSTKNIVETISKAWDSSKKDLSKNDIDISVPDINFNKYLFTNQDLCIIGVPSFGGRVPSIALERLKQMKSNNTPTIIVTTYGNRDYDDTLLELKNELKECGFNIIAAIASVAEHSIIHQIAAGRPNEKDLQEILDFANKIKDLIDSNSTTSNLQLPGNIPYKEYHGIPLKPKINNNCHECGICAKLCPTKAIPTNSPNKTDKDACISCMRCISVCPNNARTLNTMMVMDTREKLKKVCSIPKNNELFI